MHRNSSFIGSLGINQKQNIKQAAYIQYLKAFGQNGLKTLEKLQAQFDKHFDRSNVTEDLKILQKVKTLLFSYEIFMIEIYDTCQFIEVSEFGNCILKVILQLIGIIKWVLQFLTIQKKFQPQNSFFSNVKRSSNAHVRNHSNSKFSPSFIRRDSGIKTAFMLNSQQLQKQNLCRQCSLKNQQNSQDVYRAKQLTNFQLKDINDEIARIAKQYAQEEKEDNKPDPQKQKIKRFLQKRQDEEKSFLNIGLGDQSKNQEILSEIVCTLNRKGEAIRRFADLRMNSLGDSNKAQQFTEEDFQKFKNQLQADINNKYSQAKEKLFILFKEHITQYEKQKLQKMVDVQIQIQQSQEAKLTKFMNEKQMKKLKSDIKKLQKELSDQKDLSSKLKKILAEKSIQHESEIMKYRNDIITLELYKTRNELKTNKKIKKQQTNDSNLLQITPKPNPSELKSLLSIDINNEDSSNFPQENSCQEEQQPTLFIKTRNFLNTKKRLSRSKQMVKFQQIVQKQSSSNLQSCVFSIVIEPTFKIFGSQSQIFKTQKSFKNKKSIKIIKKESSCQTTNDLLQKLLLKLVPKQAIAKKQMPNKANSTIKSTNCPIFSKSTGNLKTYLKRRSSHMDSMSTYYEVQNSSAQGLDRQYFKTAMNIRANQIYTSENKDRQIKNDFIPIFQKQQSTLSSNYKKNYIQQIQKNYCLRNFYEKQNQSVEIIMKSSNPCDVQQSLNSTIKQLSPEGLSKNQTLIKKQGFNYFKKQKIDNEDQCQKQIRLGFQEDQQVQNLPNKSNDQKAFRPGHLRKNNSMDELAIFNKQKNITKNPFHTQQNSNQAIKQILQ